MARTLVVCAVLVAWPFSAPAQETVIKLTVRPADAPKPALKYQLLPELREMNPGNPIQGYMKCFMEQNHFFFNKQSEEDRDKWLAAPLKELPLEKLRNYGSGALRQADDAARLDTPDWQILLKAKSEGVHLLLPEVQQMRRVAAALKVRFRAEVADGRLDDALVTAKTMFGMARHLGDHPTLIGDLVGVAVASLAVGPLDEMLGQPGCPNLYWALTDLPSPFLDLRKGRQDGRVMALSLFAHLDETSPMTPAQLAKVVAVFQKALQYDDPAKAVRTWAEARAKDEAHVAAARTRLLDYGSAEARVKEFSPLQVVLLDEKRAFEVRRDELVKTVALPFWQAEKLLPAPPKGKGESLLGELVSEGVHNVHRAQARLDQRLAMLRLVEAVRMYVATHDGKLPTALSDVTVPLPDDPVTGKPFVVTFDGQTSRVVIKGSPPRGQEKVASFNVRYEVTFAQ